MVGYGDVRMGGGGYGGVRVGVEVLGGGGGGGRVWRC